MDLSAERAEKAISPQRPGERLATMQGRLWLLKGKLELVEDFDRDLQERIVEADAAHMMVDNNIERADSNMRQLGWVQDHTLDHGY